MRCVCWISDLYRFVYPVMKFNERELAAWASILVPDKEGLLDKRGAGISHGEIIG